ncbi:hypothetical protein Taro_009685 [Colocasia esculenta]|uniref:Uncharacterized protein n=1 Tax=Colocasia esculenta TaxID=4460 RepID=A0A843UAQ8_COLES|nr:hypothetical protein [Colocasia esculenta]
MVEEASRGLSKAEEWKTHETCQNEEAGLHLLTLDEPRKSSLEILRCTPHLKIVPFGWERGRKIFGDLLLSVVFATGTCKRRGRGSSINGEEKGRVEELFMAEELWNAHTKPFFFPFSSVATCTNHPLEVDQRVLAEGLIGVNPWPLRWCQRPTMDANTHSGVQRSGRQLLCPACAAELLSSETRHGNHWGDVPQRLRSCQVGMVSG